ncbi:Hsp20/alpha crystallin family protein [Paenibacillus dakarensis]|uniref:Hsp20/alpha crystallin family protein n=1 Tax=Paenibacillus dakarensis TaxID=1527293 RepID=UPI0006D54397|nr:Hsp20/alpha crystallin family protein [Paenibacillus dakarensis]
MNKDSIHLDWLQQDPFFKKILPFKEIKEQLKMNTDEVDQYVEKALREANIYSLFADKKRSNIKHEHVDTHNLLITKIHVPKNVHPENMSVQVNRTQIRIYGLTDEDEYRIIQLPSPIIPDQSKASFKQGSLQLRMPKMGTGRFKEVPIRYL